MRLILIRHGETAWNSEHRLQGCTDIELNEKGRGQAEALAQILRDMPISVIFSSPLKRALATAQIVAKYHNLEVNIEEDMKELNHGALEGLTRQEMETNYREFLSEWFKNPAKLKLPQGESMEDLQKRAWEIVEKIYSLQSEGMVAIVAHSLWNISLICKIMNLDLSNHRKLRQDAGSFSVAQLGGWGEGLISINNTLHLQEAGLMSVAF